MAETRMWTPETFRALANRPKVGQIDIDNMRRALRAAADLIEAADAVLEDNRRLLAERTAGVPVAHEAEPVAWTVAGEVTNWARDFSKYRTQHYVRPVYAHPAPAAGV